MSRPGGENPYPHGYSNFVAHSVDDSRNDGWMPLRERKALNSKTLHLIEDVPQVSQEHGNWCGYASLSMLLQFQGYPITQSAIFRHIHEKVFDPKTEDTGYGPLAPTLPHLAAVAEELTEGALQADLWDIGKYAALNRKRTLAKKPELTPFDVLDAYLIHRQVPCIVRTPGHNSVAIGVDKTSPITTAGAPSKIYVFNDPAIYGKSVKLQENLRFTWGQRSQGIDRKYPGNTAYLLLALRRR